MTNLKSQLKKSLLVAIVFAVILNLTLPQIANAQPFDYQAAATSSDILIFDPSINFGISFIVSDEAEKNSVKVSDNYIPTLEEMKEFVIKEAKAAGLNPEEVNRIIHCESRWDPKALGRNKNGSTDMGLWQINSIHKNISAEEKMDYKAATKWAIAKRLRDGNWSAWYCARRLAIR